MKSGVRRLLVGVVLALLVLPFVGQAQEEVHLRFTLDWMMQGPQAPFLVGVDKGYFAEEGIRLTVDRGYGSADAVTKIATGAYDLGYADINSMIEFNAQNPDEALVAVAIVLDYPPFSIMTLEGTGITTPEELAGRVLGAPAGDASRRLFPLFADAIGIELGDVAWVSMDVPLREPLLQRGNVDAISGHSFTSFLNLKAIGVPEDEIVVFLYAEYGVDLYGNAVILPPSLLEEKPEVIRGFLRALTRAWHDSIADPAAAIESIRARDALIDVELEEARLRLAIDVNMLTPDVMEFGFGDVQPDRLERSIQLVADVYNLPKVPAAGTVFDGSFLPPLADRLPRE